VTFNRKSKDGTFLTQLVDEGLLTRVSGSPDRPFEATYTLTALGEHAAEYGEYDHKPFRPDAPEPEPASVPTPKPKPKASRKAK
jgi:hypothetical protein